MVLYLMLFRWFGLPDLFGNVADASLFEAGVVVDSYAGQGATSSRRSPGLRREDGEAGRPTDSGASWARRDDKN